MFDFSRRRSNQAIVLLAVASFLFHSIFPYSGLLASPRHNTDGYLATLCTSFGQKTVFVKLDTPSDSSNTLICNECPSCIAHSQLDDNLPVTSVFVTPVPLLNIEQNVEYRESDRSDTTTSPYFSRGPPGTLV